MSQIKTVFSLSGMTCASCEKIVSKRLKIIPGVGEVIAVADSGHVTISGERKIGSEEISQALTNTHYSLITNSTI